MAAPTTILELATRRRDTLRLAATAAQTRLAAAQKSLGEQRAAVAKTRAELTALESEISALRVRLAAAPTSADGPALLDALEQLLIRSRLKQGEILGIESAIASAQAAANRAQSDSATVTGPLSVAETALAAADTETAMRATWTAALAGPPLSDMKTRAADAKAAASFADAKAQVEVLPVKLLERARDRRTAQAGIVSQREKDTRAAEDAIAAELATNGGLEGVASKEWLAFQRAATDAREFAQSAEDQLNQAVALLETVADPARPLISPEELENIERATLLGDREDAADSEKTRDDLAVELQAKLVLLRTENLKASPAVGPQNDVNTAQEDLDDGNETWRQELTDRETVIATLAADEAALNKAIMAARAANQDPDVDPPVIAAKTKVSADEGDLVTAIDDYRASDHGILHAWEASVPDSLWRALEIFQRASEILDELDANGKAAALSTTLTDAEKKFAEARFAADESARYILRVSAEAKERAALQQAAESAATTQTISALRGDN